MCQDLSGLGKAILAVALVPQSLAGVLDEEVAPAARLAVDGRSGVCGSNRGGQTGRLGFVVSNDAVFDRDVHPRSVWASGVGALVGFVVVRSGARWRARVPWSLLGRSERPEAGGRS